jgi:hypothetical protein
MIDASSSNSPSAFGSDPRPIAKSWGSSSQAASPFSTMVIRSAPARRAAQAASIPTLPGSFQETRRVVMGESLQVYRKNFPNSSRVNLNLKRLIPELKTSKSTNTGNFTRVVIVLGMETSK